jgi:hypothetical protein
MKKFMTWKRYTNLSKTKKNAVVFDSNENFVDTKISAETDGTWSAMVWFGGHYVTNVRRYFYATKAEAESACISDENYLSSRSGILDGFNVT